jgi:hypothetical protein
VASGVVIDEGEDFEFVLAYRITMSSPSEDISLAKAT